MVFRAEKQKMLAKKIQILKAIIQSDSDKKSDVLLDAANYITQLKQRIEEMTVVCEELRVVETGEDVRVGRLENNTFNVKVSCENTQDLLLLIMEAFSGMGLHMLHANINNNQFFAMEAIVEAEDEAFDADYLTQTIYMVVRKTWLTNRN